MYISNSALSLEEQTVNAQYILDYLCSKGWTKNSVCGMLGNMQSESTINPGRWQSGDVGNMSGGFGLVQWTPATKYIDWAGSGYYDMDRELERIVWEVANNVQWSGASISFLEYTQSTDTPYNLGLMFIDAYEKPFNPNQPDRGTQAEYWWEALTGGVTPPPTKKKKMSLVLMGGMLRH